jgi:hypothetical protein
VSAKAGQAAVLSTSAQAAWTLLAAAIVAFFGYRWFTKGQGAWRAIGGVMLLLLLYLLVVRAPQLTSQALAEGQSLIAKGTGQSG